MPRKTPRLTAEAIAEIRAAPRAIQNKELARKYGVTHQYVSMIRRAVVTPSATRVPEQVVDRTLRRIRGVSSTVQKRAQASDDMLDVILICLDDLKHTADVDRRERRVAVLARALRDVAESANALRSVETLAEMSDEDVRAALAEVSH